MPSPKVPSAKVLANRAKRVQLHRDTLDAATLGIADGMIKIGADIIADAVSQMRPGHLDAPPYGEGLIKAGTYGVWANGKKAGGDLQAKPRETQTVMVDGQSKTRRRVVKTPKGEVVMFVAFRAPHAHFAELGTIKEPARPFLTPAFNRHIKGAEKTVIPAMGKRVRATP